MPSKSHGPSTESREGGSTIYCVVPEDRPHLRDMLSRYLRDAGIEVISERRGLDRRSGADRRHGAGRRPRDGERRRFNPEPERRGQYRRADVALVKPPVPLPPEASRYADEIVFVERTA
jgi:hypothetical protein